MDGATIWLVTTVLIVDDHAGFRRMARRMLEGEGFDVVGEAADGAGAVAAVALLRPDVVLLDVQLPDVDGFAVARIVSNSAGSVVVLISSRAAADYRARLDGASACGFIAKSDLSGAALATLLEAIR